MADQIIGLKELDAQIVELAKSMDAEKVEPLLIKGAQKVMDYGKPITPYDPDRATGIHLRDAWIVKLMTRHGTNPAPAIAAIDEGKAPHGHLVELGTVKMAAEPYFRPAWDATKRDVKEGLVDDLKKNIDEAIT